ncbi:hypothetical protein [Burkholderia pseudomallei]|uniref:hypothetical protein n=1 Tax=Burkholderia pseudomallei TaxID=28450 RepID=UPI00193D595A|nr:hypothetical protein [Burkholderia pseudomallei]QRM23541.1 hypothetical protein JQX71_04450 [Burkholderia pseudomallei]
MKQALAVALMAVSTAAAADSVMDHVIKQAKEECQKTRANTVSRELAIVSEVSAGIEQVPPDEAKYLESESHDAFYSNNQARVNLVVQRPYYAAWNLRKTLNSLADSLRAVDMPPIMESKEIYQIKRAAWVASRAPFAVSDFSEYVAYDRTRVPHVLNQGQFDKWNSQLLSIGTEMAVYIGCVADATKK